MKDTEGHWGVGVHWGAGELWLSAADIVTWLACFFEERVEMYEKIRDTYWGQTEKDYDYGMSNELFKAHGGAESAELALKNMKALVGKATEDLSKSAEGGPANRATAMLERVECGMLRSFHVRVGRPYVS